MVFDVGDEVIHATHGLGKVVHIEEKTIHEEPTSCYVVRTPDLTIWIPINTDQQTSLRVPTAPKEFKKLFKVISSPGDLLPEDRVARKNLLLSWLRDGQLLSVCKVVRDLTRFNREAKLNDQEKSILERATKSLLTEWMHSLDVPVHEAQHALDQLLVQSGENQASVAEG